MAFYLPQTRMKRLCLFLVLLVVMSQAKAQTFSILGTLSLPEGMVAPVGGLTFTIQTDPLESFEVGGGNLESSITVVISQGMTDVGYVITLRDDSSQSSAVKRLQFNCDSGCDSLGISQQGYWSDTEGVVGFDGATQYTATQNFPVDILLERADTFSGVVSFPEGLSAVGGEVVRVILRSSSFSNPVFFQQDIELQAGELQWPFVVSVPQANGVGGWNMELSCLRCDDSIVSDIHFPTTREGDPMTLEATQGFFFVAPSEQAVDLSPIHLLLLDDE